MKKAFILISIVLVIISCNKKEYDDTIDNRRPKSIVFTKNDKINFGLEYQYSEDRVSVINITMHTNGPLIKKFKYTFDYYLQDVTVKFFQINENDELNQLSNIIYTFDNTRITRINLYSGPEMNDLTSSKIYTYQGEKLKTVVTENDFKKISRLKSKHEYLYEQNKIEKCNYYNYSGPDWYLSKFDSYVYDNDKLEIITNQIDSVFIGREVHTYSDQKLIQSDMYYDYIIDPEMGYKGSIRYEYDENSFLSYRTETDDYNSDLVEINYISGKGNLERFTNPEELLHGIPFHLDPFFIY